MPSPIGLHVLRFHPRRRASGFILTRAMVNADYPGQRLGVEIRCHS